MFIQLWPRQYFGIVSKILNLRIILQKVPTFAKWFRTVLLPSSWFFIRGKSWLGLNQNRYYDETWTDQTWTGHILDRPNLDTTYPRQDIS